MSGIEASASRDTSDALGRCGLCGHTRAQTWHTSLDHLVCAGCIADGVDPTVCVFESTTEDERGLTYAGVACATTTYAYPLMCDAAGTPHDRDALRPFTATILCERARTSLRLRESLPGTDR